MNQTSFASTADSTLLDRFHEHRDENAFAELVRRHGPMVMATARRVLHRDEDVDEAFQATMFALAKAAGKLKKKAAVAGWLHKTAYTCAAQVQRANTRWAEKIDRTMKVSNPDSRVDTPDSSAGVVNDELKEILDEELAGLSEGLRSAIVLCDLEGVTQKVVAKQLGISTSTLNDRLTKARTLLQKRLVLRGATLTASGLAMHLKACGRASATIPDESIAVISTKATRFAPGATATELGVAPSVFQLANKVLAMKPAKIAAILISAAILVPIIAVIPNIIGVDRPDVFAGTLFIDRFDDGDFEDGSPVSWSAASGASLLIQDGLVLSGNGLSIAYLDRLDLEDTSIRTRVKLENGYAIGIGARHVTAPSPTPDSYTTWVTSTGDVHAGVGGSLEFLDDVPSELRPAEQDIMIQFDVIGGKIKVWAWPVDTARPSTPLVDVDDEIDDLESGGIYLFVSGDPNTGEYSEGVFRYIHVAEAHIPAGDFDRDGVVGVSDIDSLAAAVRNQSDDPWFDLDGSSFATLADLRMLVKDTLKTWLGDSNLDGEFNSGDLVAVFRAGKYEKDIDAGWGSGDWNGDGRCDSLDLVTAFQDGGFERGPLAAVKSVPEPTSFVLVAIAVFGVTLQRNYLRFGGVSS